MKHTLSRWALLFLVVGACAGCSYKVLEDGRIDRSAVAKLARTVSEIRGLSAIQPLRVALESPAVLRQRAERDHGNAARRTELNRRQLVWAKLGLIDFSSNLNDAYSKLTTEAPFGYYDTNDKVLRIVARNTMRSEIFEVVSAVRGRDVVAGEILAHELCHALQDMHYDLNQMERAAPNSDANLALRSLVEGDASLVGFLYSATFFQDFASWVDFLKKRVARALAISGIPDYLNTRSQFPYLEGGLFVAHIYQKGGFAAVDGAYRQPPPSTEVVMHPELYSAAKGQPRQVVLPPVVTEGPEAATVLAEDVLGEHGIRHVIARNTRGVSAAKAAAGWGGDRYRVVQNSAGQLGLLLATRWDSERDAVEFCQAYRRLIGSSYTGSTVSEQGSTVRFTIADKLVVAMDCQGDAVDVVETLEPELLEETLLQMIALRTASPEVSL